MSRRYLKWIAIPLGVLLLLAIAVLIAFRVSPWPMVLIMRFQADRIADRTIAALEQHVPPGTAAMLDLQYREGDGDAYLDVFYPAEVEGTDRTLPTVFWIHGGGWIAGDKRSVAPYARILASHGYTVVSINYSLAPERQYPEPVLQANAALAYVEEHAAGLHVDTTRYVLAGNSAGAQIAAQLATTITSPDYARLMGITSAVAPEQVLATVLANGAYDTALVDYSGRVGRFLRPVLWAYSGQKDFEHSEAFRTASVIDYVTEDFPPSFITAGNGDPLEEHSTAFAARLESLGVATDTIFYAEDHEPRLGHGYIFNLDLDDGQAALRRMLAFLEMYR